MSHIFRQQGKVLISMLLLVILFLIVLLAWQQGYLFRFEDNLSQSSESVEAVSQQIINTDEVVSADIVSVNFWEAQIKVKYRHKTGRNSGYLGVEGDFTGDTVGVMTRAGEGGGVALVNRPYGHSGEYQNKVIRTRMYDPYRSDHYFATRNFETPFIFPSEASLPVVPEDIKNRYENVSITIFRNVPNYIEFAKSLTQQGFSPEHIYMHLAVCGGCAGSVVFGNDITIPQLQSVLAVLKSNNIVFDQIYYDESGQLDGVIQIGNTPPNGAKKYWVHIDQLLSAELTEQRFTELLGFTFKNPSQRARELTAKAKNLILHYENLDEARKLLDKSISLDDVYIPTYLEMARLTLAQGPFSEERISNDVLATVTKAKQIVDTAIKMDAEFADSYLMLGYLQTLQGDFALAAKSFDKAEKLGTENVWKYYYFGLLEKFKNNSKGAILQLSKAEVLEPKGDDNDWPLALVLKALAREYVKAEKIDEALRIYKRSFLLFPHWRHTNKEYMALAIADGKNLNDAETLLAHAKSKNWDEAFQVDIMQLLVKAGQAAELNEKEAIKLILHAQASDANFTLAVADLLQGEAGRKSIAMLLQKKLLTMDDLEKRDSLLIYTMRNYRGKAFQFALKNGAKPNRITRTDDLSPLMLAVILNEKPLINILLKHGAQPDLANSRGVTAIIIAEKLGYQEVHNLLLRSKKQEIL